LPGSTSTEWMPTARQSSTEMCCSWSATPKTRPRGSRRICPAPIQMECSDKELSDCGHDPAFWVSVNMMSGSKKQADIGTTEAAAATDLDALMQANIVRVFQRAKLGPPPRSTGRALRRGSTTPKPSPPDGRRSREQLTNCSAPCSPISSSPRPGVLWATTALHDSSGGWAQRSCGDHGQRRRPH
jgi:hypothetical protein